MTTERRVLIVAIVVTFVAFLDGAVINVALPAISLDLGGGLTVQQWVVDGYLITLGAFILVAGSLADSFGRLRILRIGLYAFGVTSLLCAIAPSAVLLITGRVLQGGAAALLVPSSLALIIATFPASKQGKAIGTWTAWTTGAFVVGPLLGGALVDLLSWRLIFLINVIPIVAALWLMRPLGTDAAIAHRPRIDFVGAILGIIGLGGPVFALIEQGRLGWQSPGVLVPLVIGVVAMVAFIWWERRVAEPMLPLGLFAIRNFGYGNLATLFIYAGFGFGTFAITVFVQEYGGYSATLAGAATLPSVFMLILLAGYFGGLSGRFGPRIFMTLGPFVVAAGLLFTLTIDASVNFWLQVLPGVALIGLGMAITVAPLTAAILGAVDPVRAGIGSAVNNAVARIAGLVAVACTGMIVGSGGLNSLDGYHRAAIAAALMLLAGGIASWFGIRNPAPLVLTDEKGAEPSQVA